jgi:hypothetical protein
MPSVHRGVTNTTKYSWDPRRESCNFLPWLTHRGRGAAPGRRARGACRPSTAVSPTPRSIHGTLDESRVIFYLGSHTGGAGQHQGDARGAHAVRPQRRAHVARCAARGRCGCPARSRAVGVVGQPPVATTQQLAAQLAQLVRLAAARHLGLPRSQLREAPATAPALSEPLRSHPRSLDHLRFGKQGPRKQSQGGAQDWVMECL